MTTYFYEQRISHRDTSIEGAAPFHGTLDRHYLITDEDGKAVDSFLKLANARKVLGPAKFVKQIERRHTVQ